MIGIYKYTNKYNGHSYIGKSIDIKRRQYNHKSSVYNKKANDYDSQFHQAVRKYGGFEAFDFEILIEIPEELYSLNLINQLEKFFIKKYNSYKNGYNATEGGEDNPNRAQVGSKNGRAKLTEADVIDIRNCYNNHIPFKKVYEKYGNKIGKRGLQKVWWFQTWKHIHPEYHTEENRYWHSHDAKNTNL